MRASVSDWALDANLDPIPLAKLVNVSNTLPVTTVRETSATLNAHDIRHLGTQRVEVIPAPGPGRYIVVKEVAISRPARQASVPARFTWDSLWLTRWVDSCQKCLFSLAARVPTTGQSIGPPPLKS